MDQKDDATCSYLFALYYVGLMPAIQLLLKRRIFCRPCKSDEHRPFPIFPDNLIDQGIAFFEDPPSIGPVFSVPDFEHSRQKGIDGDPA